MLHKRTCPLTGLINYYECDERLLPIGSIAEEASGRFVWRIHVGDGEAGAAGSRRAAEAALRRLLAHDAVHERAGCEPVG
ncbi:MAG: hypothetical protein F9K44_03995 [Hyphomicrobiaceae bacterium]|nr:MAG: hypothetical protein F9K44_03995 [Hyphomicrobiaceae bacterium]